MGRRPAWISDEDLKWVPAEARQEVVELIASAYQELVTQAQTTLERAAGEEFVYLFWLGMQRTLHLRGLAGRVPTRFEFPDLVDVEREVNRYLHLGLAKERVTNLLLRLGNWYRQRRQEALLEGAAGE